eukprot:scaffold120931_cov18-Tisochrysis_lutea.AAC.2
MPEMAVMMARHAENAVSTRSTVMRAFRWVSSLMLTMSSVSLMYSFRVCKKQHRKNNISFNAINEVQPTAKRERGAKVPKGGGRGRLGIVLGYQRKGRRADMPVNWGSNKKK